MGKRKMTLAEARAVVEEYQLDMDSASLEREATDMLLTAAEDLALLSEAVAWAAQREEGRWEAGRGARTAHTSRKNLNAPHQMGRFEDTPALALVAAYGAFK